MSNHENFRRLSSLSAIGQLLSHENQELIEHLRECESCREVHDDYSHIIQHQMPQADTARWGSQRLISNPVSSMHLRDRFLGRARAEGIEFSIDAERAGGVNKPHHSRGRWLPWWRPALAFGTLTTLALLGIVLARKHQLVRHSNNLNASEHETHEIEALRSQLTTLRQTIELNSTQMNRMRTENRLSEELLRGFRQHLQEAQAQGNKLSAEVSMADSEKTAFSNANQQKDAIIAELRGQIDEQSRQRADNLSQLVIQRQQIHDLVQSLEQETENFERERQLMAVTNDVRQLMGARNLHIMDVHDVNAQNGPAKAFGRVFYAEGQSLIFYAFDLPSTGLSPAKYTFHAWGARELDSKSPRNLGAFEVDDHEQRRWVLKLNDPSLLAGIESVFVTAESLHDVREPHGKKLLYAYLGGQPNHP